MLHEGYFEGFFKGLGRADLAESLFAAGTIWTPEPRARDLESKPRAVVVFAWPEGTDVRLRLSTQRRHAAYCPRWVRANERRGRPGHGVLAEVYRDAAAAAAHKQEPHYATWRDTVAEMMAQPRASTKFSAVFPAGSADWAVGAEPG